MANSPETAWNTYEVPIPAGILRAVPAVGDQLDLLVAAYAKVTSVLTGERAVSAGFRSAAHERARLLRLTVEDGSWLDLLKLSHEARQRPADRLPAGTLPGETGAGYETALDLSGWTGPSGPDIDHSGLVSLWSLVEVGGAPALRMKYRPDCCSEVSAVRRGGYFCRALEAIVHDVAADHGDHVLVSPEELELQMRELSGPAADLPPEPFHRAFSAQCAKTPDAPAVKDGDRACSYLELDRLANRIAHSLLRHGLSAEGVVAVSLPRSVEWVAAIIGVLRAGGAYLPVDPGWPAERAKVVLEQAEAQILLTGEPAEDGGGGTGEPAFSAARVLNIRTALQESNEGTPDVDVVASQLAYIYFTSGSTGAPKGAMCEHAGVMNHLVAKLEHLDITAEDLLVQSAPATFDISLWQAIAPLLVGAATMIVPAGQVRDIDAFITEAGKAGATVLQVVPSYLELLTTRLAELEPAHRLPTVRHVVVTGEVLKKELVERWFALCSIPLTNAYGATEASDDTTHHTMVEPPASTSVPVGKPVRNVRVLIIDDRAQVLPLGAPGEIAFAGVCVGRGYVNDEKRTARAFSYSRTDPPVRIYRTGDYGRWCPDGVLEFLGRRDEQIKIRGMRVELGEIENAMLRVSGVRDAAVVVKRGADPDTGLVGYYTAAHPVAAADLRSALAGTLPGYMIPAHLRRLPVMPLTDNSKIDKAALVDQADVAGPAREEGAAPRTESELMLAQLWAELLGLPLSNIGRNDDFFRRGGSSLSAIQLVVRLGKRVSLLDVVSNPVLADLAAAVDGSRHPGGEP
ncbi:non-ribosomal peptide synthetase [Amycolatopsis sp. FBCC-B4732]|uniref:non-ribosomal peptide synthetase n=1 Tax=Amycolatopsis sp. FBCC-B4732 TaxID=3079339 RepID=UPI001FF5F60E|nr:non-ribosomal peptide synthetase [Amycolatopsis sp. FBCC-B4732]UOX89997.1 non-ribosomal peptide synthetase [Amycolatopsis sp. FBCC-B4732]